MQLCFLFRAWTQRCCGKAEEEVAEEIETNFSAQGGHAACQKKSIQLVVKNRRRKTVHSQTWALLKWFVNDCRSSRTFYRFLDV